MSDYSNLPHWNYFRLLERDLEECFRYVAPAEAISLCIQTGSRKSYCWLHQRSKTHLVHGQ